MLWEARKIEGSKNLSGFHDCSLEMFERFCWLEQREINAAQTLSLELKANLYSDQRLEIPEVIFRCVKPVAGDVGVQKPGHLADCRVWVRLSSFLTVFARKRASFAAEK